eukprot:CAMPEP_0172356506 /NCGR_PEP_ID=MMETSP1060-20121228/871_1 /TAXON_ID=37318 /ORGANISM="Pseudo-nitzschia pungens, Strain cf. cingulata" /LENGTH=323 /DNA_ID=CAMNT_0013076645 /DNA_START=123 /DNA_END=1094 /DNA_ORIENTATION=-
MSLSPYDIAMGRCSVEASDSVTGGDSAREWDISLELPSQFSVDSSIALEVFEEITGIDGAERSPDDELHSCGDRTIISSNPSIRTDERPPSPTGIQSHHKSADYGILRISNLTSTNIIPIEDSKALISLQSEQSQSVSAATEQDQSAAGGISSKSNGGYAFGDGSKVDNDQESSHMSNPSSVSAESFEGFPPSKYGSSQMSNPPSVLAESFEGFPPSKYGSFSEFEDGVFEKVGCSMMYDSQNHTYGLGGEDFEAERERVQELQEGDEHREESGEIIPSSKPKKNQFLKNVAGAFALFVAFVAGVATAQVLEENTKRRKKKRF